MSLIKPNWTAPKNIKAGTTTRRDGQSKSPFDSNNLALHVGDDDAAVKANRQALIKEFNLPGEPIWLEQTHSNTSIVVEDTFNRKADAAITKEKENILAVLTADCLPILICDRNGSEIAAIHGGWRGLASGIIENTLDKLEHPASELIAWIGPHICASCFETGDEVVETFAKAYPSMRDCFTKQNEHWYGDLGQLVNGILLELGITDIFHSDLCTKEDEEQFYSYRRDGETGRMATLIWIEQES